MIKINKLIFVLPIIMGFSVSTTGGETNKIYSEAEQNFLHSVISERTVGAPVSCISKKQSSYATVINDKTIMFSDTPDIKDSKIIYINKPRKECKGAKQRGIMKLTYNRTVCNGDFASVLDIGSSRNYIPVCSWGDFIPYSQNDN